MFEKFVPPGQRRQAARQICLRSTTGTCQKSLSSKGSTTTIMKTFRAVVVGSFALCWALLLSPFSAAEFVVEGAHKGNGGSPSPLHVHPIHDLFGDVAAKVDAPFSPSTRFLASSSTTTGHRMLRGGCRPCRRIKQRKKQCLRSCRGHNARRCKRIRCGKLAKDLRRCREDNCQRM